MRTAAPDETGARADHERADRERGHVVETAEADQHRAHRERRQQRRQRIGAHMLDICRRAGAWIIEDGVYASAEPALPPLAALAPEIAFHVNGLSKSLGPGLQIGVLALPARLDDAAEDALRDLPMAPSPLSCAVVEEWLATDVISSIQRDLHHEARRRSNLAISLLGASELISHPGAYNTWPPMERDAANRVASVAAAMGIKLTPPESMMVNPEDRASGIRLCLGGPSFDDLPEALTLLAGLLKQRA